LKCEELLRGDITKAFVITAPEQTSLAELEKPQIGPEDVLIHSHAVGLCDSDVALYRGIRPEGYYHYPVIPGNR
jgi:L-iditol 2-dehydrogenase